MISKIIQKEKERQESNFEWKNAVDCGECRTQIACHKNSLINLKEYMEEIVEIFDNDSDYKQRLEVREDIKELTEMIKKYE